MVELVSGWVSGRGLGGERLGRSGSCTTLQRGNENGRDLGVLAQQQAVRGVQIYSFCVPNVAEDLTLYLGLQLVSIGICVASAIAHGKWILGSRIGSAWAIDDVILPSLTAAAKLSEPAMKM